MKIETEPDRKAFVTLRFAGDELDPREIEKLLPVAATRTHRKGEEFFAGRRAGNLIGRTGMWFLTTDTLVPSDDLEDHLRFVQELLYPAPDDDTRIAKLHAILQRDHAHARVTCFWRGHLGQSPPKSRLDSSGRSPRWLLKSRPIF